MKYATFGTGKAYHIAILSGDSETMDKTMCGVWLVSRNGVKLSERYLHGGATPTIHDEQPSDAPFCKMCQRTMRVKYERQEHT